MGLVSIESSRHDHGTAPANESGYIAAHAHNSGERIEQTRMLSGMRERLIAFSQHVAAERTLVFLNDATGSATRSPLRLADPAEAPTRLVRSRSAVQLAAMPKRTQPTCMVRHQAVGWSGG